MNKLILLALIAGMFSSCDIINPKEEIPSNIYIPDFNLTTDYVQSGSNSENISDAWIYLDDQLQYVVEVPATVPLLATGEHKISIIPGVKENGISSVRVQYPFYSLYSQNYSLGAATVDTIIPSIGYKDSVKFSLKEDFEGGNDFTGMTVTSDASKVFEGTKSGVVKLDELNRSFKAVSSSYTLPTGGAAVWMEMDYMNSQQFNVFIHTPASNDPQYLLTITPKSAWNKIYLNLTPVLSGISGNNFRIQFSAAMPDSVSTSEIYWDNIKLVHF